MKVKVGDKVKVLAGKHKGDTGTIIKTLKKDNKVIVEGVNIVKKHVKPNRFNEVGSIQEKEAPIHVSNVMKLEGTKGAAKVAKETPKATKTAKTTKKTEKKAS